MNLTQVLVAIVVMIVRYHLVRLTLETHTLSTSRTCHPVTAVQPLNRHQTVFVRTFSYVILLHELLKQSISTFFCLLTGQPPMIVHLTLETVGTLASITFKVGGFHFVHLLTSSSKAKSDLLRIFSHILIH